MADEDNVVVKSSGSAGGLIPLITLVLVVVCIGISAFSMITVMGLKKGLTVVSEGEGEEEGVLPGDVSVMDIDTFDFTKNFIFRYNDVNDPKTTNTVVVDIRVGILRTKETEDDAVALKTLMASKEGIIRDGLETLMKTKSFEAFKTEEGQATVKADILLYLQERLVTDLIIDVYFNNFITQTD